MASWNIFPLLARPDNGIQLLLSLLVTIGLIVVSIFVFSLGIFSLNIAKIWRTFIGNTLIVLGVGVFFSLFHFLLFQLHIFDGALANGGVTIG